MSPWELTADSGHSLGPHLMYCGEKVKQAEFTQGDISGLEEAHVNWAATCPSILDTYAINPGSQVCTWGFFPLGFDVLIPILSHLTYCSTAATFTCERHASKGIVFLPGCWLLSSLEGKDLANFSCSVSDPGVLCKVFPFIRH